MIKKNVIFVRIKGTGINESFRCRSHDIISLPAGTYHKFEMESGAITYVNDFGIRSVTIADSVEDLD